MKKNLHYLDRFYNKKILVIGDLMVDRFTYGNVSRISPEAPVPVVQITKEINLPGGAGNVANNIAELGSQVYLVSVIGDDITGEKLKEELDKRNINSNGVFVDTERPTTVKTRIIAHNQQVVRVDKEIKKEISPKMTAKILEYINAFGSVVDAILISDYGKGVIKPAVLKEAIRNAKKYDIPVTVDPKVEHFLLYKNVTCITPNTSEAIAGMRTQIKGTDEEIEKLGMKILKKLKCESVIITRGEKGMSVFEVNSKPYHIPTRAREVFDVTGAGDTVIAVLTVCLTTGAPLRISAEIANYAAGIVVGKLGTATVTTEEIKNVIKESYK